METTNKLDLTMKIFEQYNKRFLEKRLTHNPKFAYIPEQKEEIIQTLKDVLKFDDSLIPEIKIHDVQEQIFEGLTVKHFLFESWKDFYGISSLFVPDESVPRPAPLILVCPGHGGLGRLTESYQKMALNLAKKGSYVLLLENIGQGCRSEFGHFNVPEAFYCGLTVQGLIIAETRAWVKFMKNEPYIDSTRIGATGNSGGGTLTQFLSALEPDISALASSGYPSEYHYIAEKEYEHCDCNIFPGMIGKLEMWEVYSIFAPKPLFLSTGCYDQLIPLEYFNRSARKVNHIYSVLNKSDNFKFKATDTTHSWDTEDLKVISAFFKDVFDLPSDYDYASDNLISHNDVTLKFPQNAITTAQVAQNLTGKTAPEGVQLYDVFKPKYNGEYVNADEIVDNFGRGRTIRIFSQFEAFLSE